MPEFQCELCRVHVNSQDQLNIHTNGQKHQKKLKMKLTVTPVAALGEYDNDMVPDNPYECYLSRFPS